MVRVLLAWTVPRTGIPSTSLLNMMDAGKHDIDEMILKLDADFNYTDSDKIDALVELGPKVAPLVIEAINLGSQRR